MPRPALLLLLAIVVLLPGCATGTSPDFQVPAGRYTQAFDAARDALVAGRFEIERVDAAAGVITTAPKSTAGLATPWDTEQSTLAQEWEDLINGQQRRVRVTFEPAGPVAGPAAPDLRTTPGPMVGHVQVVIERLHRAGWRLETTSMRFSAFAQDPNLSDRGMWPAYYVPFSQDPLLAARLAAKIQRATPAPAAAPAGQPH